MTNICRFFCTFFLAVFISLTHGDVAFSTISSLTFSGTGITPTTLGTGTLCTAGNNGYSFTTTSTGVTQTGVSTAFSFSIPPAIINSIVVTFTVVDTGNDFTENAVRVSKNGALFNATTFITTPTTVLNYPTGTDPVLWGTTWSSNDINSGFGIQWQGIRPSGSGSRTYSLTCVNVTVTYTPSTTTGEVTTAESTTGATTQEVTTGERTTAVQTTAAQTTAVQTTAAQTTAVQTTAIRTTGERTTGERTTAVQTTVVQTTAIRTTGERTTGERTTAERTTGERTTAERTTAERTTGERTTAERTTAEKTTAERTTGEQTTFQVLTFTTALPSGTTRGIVNPTTAPQVTTELPPQATTGSASGNGNSGITSAPAKKSNTGLIVGIIIAVVAILIIAIILIFILMRRRKPTDEGKKLVEMNRMESASAYKEMGVSVDQNPRYRRTMEDEHIHVDNYCGNPKMAYFGVYDGHGGDKTAKIVREKLHVNLEAAIKENPENIIKALEEAFLKTDSEIQESAGSTAVAAVLTENKLYTANIGDARIVVGRNKKALRMTQDHKATDPDEQKRIEQKGGMVLMGKVGAQLAVSRAFGDAELKKWVTAEPFTNSIDLQKGDSVIILACDGLWDVVTDQEAIDLLEGESSAQAMAEKLVKAALEKGTTDNVSIMVVTLRS